MMSSNLKKQTQYGDSDSGDLCRTVLLTTDALGGVWNFVLTLSQSLALNGIRVIIAGLGPFPARPKVLEALTNESIILRWKSYPLEWMNDGLQYTRRSAEWLLSLAEEYAVSIVHLNQLALARRLWEVPCLITAHSCVRTWHRSVRGKEAGPEWDDYSFEVSESLRSAQSVTAPTEAMLQALRNEYGNFPSAGSVPNGVTLKLTSEPKQEYILTVGRLWDEAKNIEMLEAISPSIPWPIVAIGSSKHPDGYELAFSKLLVLGELAIPATQEWMAHASIFVAPVRYEPFGLAILEAAMHGCALVLGDIPTLRELWKGCAIFVDPNSPKELIQTLRELIEDPKRREQLGRQAQQHSTRYSVQRKTTRYLQIYGDLIRGHNRLLPASQKYLIKEEVL